MYNSRLNITFLITPKHSHILSKGSEILPLTQPCKEIDEGKFLCYEKDISPEEENKCVEDLMKFSTKITSCTPLTVNTSDIKIKAIQPDSWIIFTSFPTYLTEYCANDMSRHTIMGTYLITLDNICDVKIGRVTLRKRRIQTGEVMFRSMPNIHLPSIIAPEDIKQRKIINLDQIDLENLKFLSLALKDKSEVLTSDNELVNIHSVSIGTLIIYVILIFAFMLFVYRNKTVILRKIQNHQPQKSDDDFELTEGGVIRGDIHPRTVLVH